MSHSVHNQWEMLSKAIALAAEKFNGVLDKGGKPYTLHLIRVMSAMPDDDPELQQIAVLHDVVEDTDITLKDLINMGFSPRVIDALKLLTHDADDSYIKYILGVKSNPDCIKVKIADLKDNSNISRLKGISDKDVKRMIKYQRSYMFLTDKMSEYEYTNGENV